MWVRTPNGLRGHSLCSDKSRNGSKDAGATEALSTVFDGTRDLRLSRMGENRGKSSGRGDLPLFFRLFVLGLQANQETIT